MFLITPLSFDALSKGSLGITAQTLYWHTLESLGYVVVVIVWVHLHSDDRGGLRKRTRFERECVMALQGHPRSLILAPIESAYAISYWSSIVTVVLSCPVSGILQVSEKSDPTPIPPEF